MIPGHRTLGKSFGSWGWVWSDEKEREGRGVVVLSERAILEVRKKEKGTPGGVPGHLEAEAVGSQGSAHEPYGGACWNVDSGSVGLGCGFGISNKLQES